MFTVEAGFQLAKSSNQLYVKFTTLLRGWPFIFCAFPVRKTQRHLLNKLIALQMRSWVRSSGEKISPHPDISLVWIKLYKIYTFLVKRACVHLQIIQMMEKLTLTAPKKTTARRSADSSLLRCTVRTVKQPSDLMHLSVIWPEWLRHRVAARKFVLFPNGWGCHVMSIPSGKLA